MEFSCASSASRILGHLGDLELGFRQVVGHLGLELIRRARSAGSLWSWWRASSCRPASVGARDRRGRAFADRGGISAARSRSACGGRSDGLFRKCRRQSAFRRSPDRRRQFEFASGTGPNVTDSAGLPRSGAAQAVEQGLAVGVEREERLGASNEALAVAASTCKSYFFRNLTSIQVFSGGSVSSACWPSRTYD